MPSYEKAQIKFKFKYTVRGVHKKDGRKLTEALSLALIREMGIFWVWFRLVMPSSSVGVSMSS